MRKHNRGKESLGGREKGLERRIEALAVEAFWSSAITFGMEVLGAETLEKGWGRSPTLTGTPPTRNIQCRRKQVGTVV